MASHFNTIIRTIVVFFVAGEDIGNGAGAALLIGVVVSGARDPGGVSDDVVFTVCREGFWLVSFGVRTEGMGWDGVTHWSVRN